MACLCELWSHCWVLGFFGGIIWIYTGAATCQRRLRSEMSKFFCYSLHRNFGTDFSFFFFFQKKDIERIIIFFFGSLDGIEPMTYLNPNPFHNHPPNQPPRQNFSLHSILYKWHYRKMEWNSINIICAPFLYLHFHIFCFHIIPILHCGWAAWLNFSSFGKQTKTRLLQEMWSFSSREGLALQSLIIPYDLERCSMDDPWYVDPE